ncbi:MULTISPECIES: SH3 domain-containing protein [unclassified Anabaena]|uniref:SH3 domain-containing protein n=1 Tax=unclassified Anabaena TaxID=2619674 RepID=UPI0014461E90|nr:MULTISPECIES: SH3 domain-containing protein [unclassified Anabaena]MTJ10970.1 SH3 domain-containing protein [Anabaena sp. UHCC 0204]MTJ53729.1 SH3 domain-containing protein [Anabaena sp. UHCC 0253]
MFTNLLKFILGFVLAIAVLLGTGLTVALYFVNRTAVAPPKPMFANDNPSSNTPKPKASVKPLAGGKATPKSSPKPKPTPTPTESSDSLPPGAYQGTVTWPQGLSIRSEPDANSQSTGGVAGNKEVIILEESADKKWQKIRIPDTNQEGWVKAGNIKRSE